MQGSILGNIRKSFFWENIRIFFILELERSISENTIISSKIRVSETIHTQARGFHKFLLYCKQAKLSNILTASNKGIYRKLVRTLCRSRNFYIKRNNNKTDSIETGRIVIACFLPLSVLEKYMDTKLFWLMMIKFYSHYLIYKYYFYF